MTEQELNTGTALNAEIVDLTNKIAAIDSSNYSLAYVLIDEKTTPYAYLTDDLTQATKDALKITIRADLQATLDAKQAEFDAL